jgi:ubiquinone/menaquinone biosynthesis C-methylase UbiE
MTHDVFDAHAEEYDRWYDEHGTVYRQEVRLLMQYPEAVGADLEVGVGTGRLAVPLGIRLGIDPSLPMLHRARARGVEVIQGVAEALPFREASMGSVLVMTALCYFDDPRQAFREILRVLRPGGRLTIGFLGRGGEIAERYRTTGDKGTFLAHAIFYTPGEVTRMLGEAGFSSIERDTAGRAFMKGFHVMTARRPER